MIVFHNMKHACLQIMSKIGGPGIAIETAESVGCPDTHTCVLLVRADYSMVHNCAR